MSEIARRGLCLVIAAPSGGGKTTIAQAMLAEDSSLIRSVSVTTRKPRPGEADGRDYHFIDSARFAAMREAGQLLEWAGVFGRQYGTPRAPVEAAIAAGRDVVLAIDVQGHALVRAALPGDMVGLFVLPPTMAELARRLDHRAADTEEQIATRLATARDEIARAVEFDHVLVNDDLDASIRRAQAVLEAARCARARLSGLGAFIAGLG
jgi:guanylate kinase